jgi:hypothetical protein
MSEVDVVDQLLAGRPHKTAQLLRQFLRVNPTFFLTFVSRFFWLKKRGRPGAAKTLFMLLRQDNWKRLEGVDHTVNNDLFPLLSRVCILLYPTLNNRTLKLVHCGADLILGTDIVPREGKKKGMILRASEATRLELAQLPPAPEPPLWKGRSTRHKTVTPEEAAYVVPYVKDLVAKSPHPRNRLLQSFWRHVKAQPEVFFLAEKKMRSLLAKELHHFSVLDALAYAVQTAKRGREKGKRFTQPNTEASLYCRSLIRRNPQFNGWAEFKEDSKGKIRPGQANAVLGCHLAPKPINGEPHPRLLWHRDSDSVSEAPAQGRLFCSKKKTEAR